MSGRIEITFTSSRFSRMPLCLPARRISASMRLTGNSPNLPGIFRETCKVLFLYNSLVRYSLRSIPSIIKVRRWNSFEIYSGFVLKTAVIFSRENFTKYFRFSHFFTLKKLPAVLD